MKRTWIFAAIIATATTTTVSAHTVWIERDKTDTAHAYYGEWQEGLREDLASKMPTLKDARAFLGEPTDSSFSEELKGSVLDITAKGKGDLRLIQDKIPVSVDSHSDRRIKQFFLAKSGRTETKGVLELEIVPVASESNTFVVLLHGKPVPKASVTVYGPPKWGKEFQADEQGKVTIETPWAGDYLVETSRFEEEKGGSGDDAYNHARYVSTVFFTTRKTTPLSTK